MVAVFLPALYESQGDSTEVEKKVDNGDENKDIPSIDVCASLLCMLDERSYHRRMICDANELSRQILLPLSLPWMHKGNPVARNIPYDIDDMTEVLMADDGKFTPYERGPLGFGRFDIGQMRRGPTNTRLATSADSWCTASRRSHDPGIIEVSSIALPLYASCPSKARENHNTGDVDDQPLSVESTNGTDNSKTCDYVPAGEISLRYYEHTAKEKKRKIAEVRSCAQRQFISVKVNSSSSRASIFSDIKLDGKSRHGKLLEASLPAEVQNGKFLSTSKAQIVADSLGSYDSRYGLSSTTGRNGSRVSCGRTRLIWTQKNPPDQPQKVSFSSSLTGHRFEGATQKRPRDIRLALIVGGEIFGADNASNEWPDKKFASISSFPAERSSSQSEELFDHPHAQCMLDDEAFVKNILQSGNERGKSRGRNIGSQPVLECLPDSSGLIGVVCSSTGKIAISSAHECLNHAAKMNSPKCTVCWGSNLDKNTIVRECHECGVLAHQQCCYDKGQLHEVSDNGFGKDQIWRCAVCCFKSNQHAKNGNHGASMANEQAKKSKRKAKLPQWLQDSHIDDPLTAGKSENTMATESHGIQCALCSFSGGAMSRVRIGNECHWIHEVCRVWLKGRQCTQDASSGLNAECVLCGKGPASNKVDISSENTVGALSGYVLKCAASRCHVHFHPMCALVSTKLSESNTNSEVSFIGEQKNVNNTLLELSKQVDRQLCSCYTLTALDIEVTTGASGKDPGAERQFNLPIGFCGIHNPKREASFRGLYPGGKYLTPEVMRIPVVKQD